jgi:glycosyl transferase family 25
MKIFIINMDRSKDRLQRISQELKSMNLDYERFPAIEGKKLSNDEIVSKTSFFGRTFIFTHSAIGCALSHLTLWEKAASMPDDFVCIMEDDATFTQEFPKVLENMQLIYDNTKFDILDLYGEFITHGKTVYENTDYTIVKPLFGLSMCCYILSKEGAKKLVELSKGKVTLNIDSHIAYLNSIGSINQLLLARPQVVEPSLEISTINNLNRGGVFNKVIAETPWKEYKKYTNSNIINFRLVHSVSPYLLVLSLLFIISILKKWYAVSIIIFLEILMLIYDIEV